MTPARRIFFYSLVYPKIHLVLSILFLFLVLVAPFIWVDISAIITVTQARGVANGVVRRLDQTTQSLQTVARQASASGPLVEGIRTGNETLLVALLTDLTRQSNASGGFVTDANGSIIAIVGTTQHKGDYIFQTAPWGREVSLGHVVAAIERDKDYPLIAVSGAPISKDSVLVGGVFLLSTLDDNLAQELKKSTLSQGDQLVFYSKEAGLVGDTFNSNSVKIDLRSFFNSGSEWVIGAKTEDRVQIEDSYYILENRSFPGITHSPGGVVLLFRYDPVRAGLTLAAINVGLFALVTWLLHRRRSNATPS